MNRMFGGPCGVPRDSAGVAAAAVNGAAARPAAVVVSRARLIDPTRAATIGSAPTTSGRRPRRR
jgi:hypothetical protein